MMSLNNNRRSITLTLDSETNRPEGVSTATGKERSDDIMFGFYQHQSQMEVLDFVVLLTKKYIETSGKQPENGNLECQNNEKRKNENSNQRT